MGLLDGVFQKVAKKIGDTGFPGVCIELEYRGKRYKYCPPGASWGSPNPNAPVPTHGLAQGLIKEQAAKGIYITPDQLPQVVPPPPPPRPETIAIDPLYATGGTPSGEGSLGRENPGYDFGGNPIIDVLKQGFGLTKPDDKPPEDPEKVEGQKTTTAILLGGLLLLILIKG